MYRIGRITYMDAVKLLTIYLVILGHVTQMMIHGWSVGEHLWKLIYSFHMPLFMLLCGFFVSNRMLKLSFVDMLKAKSIQLLLPAVTCTVICCLYLFFARDTVNFRDEIIGNSWFLKTLFVYYVLFWLLKHTKLNDWLLFTRRQGEAQGQLCLGDRTGGIEHLILLPTDGRVRKGSGTTIQLGVGDQHGGAVQRIVHRAFASAGREAQRQGPLSGLRPIQKGGAGCDGQQALA